MKEKYKKILVQIVVTAVSVLVLAAGYYFARGEKSALENEDRSYSRFERAKVVSVGERVDLSDIPDAVKDLDISFTCVITEGSLKGTELSAVQNVSTYMGQEIKEIEVGDKIIITLVDDMTENGTWYFAEYVRSDMLLILLALFLAALLIFGRMSGFKTIISLSLTVGAVFFMLIPAVFSGQNIYIWSLLVCLYIIVMTLCIVNGLRHISLAAGLGCISGVIFSSAMILIADRVTGLTGFVDECSMYLSFIDMNGKVDLRGLVFAAVTIGSVGAVMDVAVDISASLHEIALKIKNPTFGELVGSGFTIGRDIMGTMSNTLILAYIGSSLCFVLLVIYNSSDSMLYLFNREIIVVEALKILIGSLGILMTIPLTSVICAYLYTRCSFLSTEEKVSASAPASIPFCSGVGSDDAATAELKRLAMGVKKAQDVQSKDKDE